MSCPDIEKIGQEDLDDATRAHLDGCAACRERRDRLSRLLAFPAVATPPPDVLPRLLAQIDRQMARGAAGSDSQTVGAGRVSARLAAPASPVRSTGHRRLVAAVFAFAVIGSSLVLVLSDDGARAREQRLEALVVESEWRALGYASEQDFLKGDSTAGGTK